MPEGEMAKLKYETSDGGVGLISFGSSAFTTIVPSGRMHINRSDERYLLTAHRFPSRSATATPVVDTARLEKSCSQTIRSAMVVADCANRNLTMELNMISCAASLD